MTVRINGRPIQKQGDPIQCGDTHGIGLLNIRAEGIPIAIVGQLTTGHGGFPPTAAVQGSENVRATNLPVVRLGDAYAPHTNGQETHTGLAAPI